MPTTEEILAERGKQYGDFTTHADVTQALKRAMYNQTNWNKLSPSHREALEMIQHKVGRIINGNPLHRDSWDDIAGYAKLASERCHGIDK